MNFYKLFNRIISQSLELHIQFHLNSNDMKSCTNKWHLFGRIMFKNFNHNKSLRFKGIFSVVCNIQKRIVSLANGDTMNWNMYTILQRLVDSWEQ